MLISFISLYFIDKYVKNGWVSFLIFSLLLISLSRLPRDVNVTEISYYNEDILLVDTDKIILHDEVIRLLPWDRVTKLDLNSNLLSTSYVNIEVHQDIWNWKIYTYAFPRLDKLKIYYIENDRKRN